MRIQIPLYVPEKVNSYQSMKGALKQLELSVHHAQKAVESAEKEGVSLEEAGLSFVVIKDNGISEEEDNIVQKPIIDIYIDEDTY